MEEVWTMLSPEFGKDARKTAVIVRALYGLNQQEQCLGANFQSAWNPWDISLVRMIQIYGLHQTPCQKMGKVLLLFILQC